MAVACAQGFHADRLIFLTDVDGVRDGAGVVQPQLSVDEALKLIEHGAATGGMQAKIDAAINALANGVSQVLIAPGAQPGVVASLLAGSRIGTRMVSNGRA